MGQLALVVGITKVLPVVARRVVGSFPVEKADGVGETTAYRVMSVGGSNTTEVVVVNMRVQVVAVSPVPAKSSVAAVKGIRGDSVRPRSESLEIEKSKEIPRFTTEVAESG